MAISSITSTGYQYYSEVFARMMLRVLRSIHFVIGH